MCSCVCHRACDSVGHERTARSPEPRAGAVGLFVSLWEIISKTAAADARVMRNFAHTFLQLQLSWDEFSELWGLKAATWCQLLVSRLQGLTPVFYLIFYSSAFVMHSLCFTLLPMYLL